MLVIFSEFFVYVTQIWCILLSYNAHVGVHFKMKCELVIWIRSVTIETVCSFQPNSTVCYQYWLLRQNSSIYKYTRNEIKSLFNVVWMSECLELNLFNSSEVRHKHTRVTRKIKECSLAEIVAARIKQHFKNIFKALISLYSLKVSSHLLRSWRFLRLQLS